MWRSASLARDESGAEDLHSTGRSVQKLWLGHDNFVLREASECNKFPASARWVTFGDSRVSLSCSSTLRKYSRIISWIVRLRFWRAIANTARRQHRPVSWFSRSAWSCCRSTSRVCSRTTPFRVDLIWRSTIAATQCISCRRWICRRQLRSSIHAWFRFIALIPTKLKCRLQYDAPSTKWQTTARTFLVSNFQSTSFQFQSNETQFQITEFTCSSILALGCHLNSRNRCSVSKQRSRSTRSDSRCQCLTTRYRREFAVLSTAFSQSALVAWE